MIYGCPLPEEWSFNVNTCNLSWIDARFNILLDFWWAFCGFNGMRCHIYILYVYIFSLYIYIHMLPHFSVMSLHLPRMSCTAFSFHCIFDVMFLLCFDMLLEPQTTIYKWLFQWDDSRSLDRKWLEITKHPFMNGCFNWMIPDL